MSSPAQDIRNKAQAIWSGAKVYGRGRTWIKHQHPTDLHRYMLDTCINPIHYGSSLALEIDTTWVTSSNPWLWEMTHNDFHAYLNNGSYRYVDAKSGEYVNLDVTALEWRNDGGQTQNIPLVTVSPSASDNTISWDGLFGAGTQLQVQTQPARLSKFLNLATNTSLPVPTIGGTNIQLVFRFRLQRSNGVVVFINGIEWNENTQTRTGDVVEFRLASTGQSIWWFTIPNATDNLQDRINGTQVFKRSGANLFCEVEIPYSWLSSAVYPISIDPTIAPTIAISTNDAAETSAGVCQTNWGLCSIATASADSEHQGFRWVANIPTGATITSAVVSQYFGANAVDLTVDMQDADNATAFTNDNNNISGRTLTGHSVVATFTANGWSEQDLATVTDAVQHVVSRTGWLPGSNMVCVITARSTNVCSIAQYDSGYGIYATLHVEYTGDLVFTDGYNGDVTSYIDTKIYEGSPGTNYGEDGWFESYQDSPRAVGLLKFDLSSLAGKTIVDAKLYLHTFGSWGADRNIGAYRILSGNSYWVEGTASWNYQDGSHRWTGDTGSDGGTDAGCSVSGTDFSATALGTSTYHANDPDDTEMIFDLDLTEFSSMVSSNQGIRISVITSALSIAFYSSDDPSVSSPKLIVQYSTGASTSDNQPAYLKGRSSITDNQPSYLKGRANITDNQPSYLNGTSSIFPFTDDFTGSNNDPWSAVKWTTSTG